MPYAAHVHKRINLNKRKLMPFVYILVVALGAPFIWWGIFGKIFMLLLGGFFFFFGGIGIGSMIGAPVLLTLLFLAIIAIGVHWLKTIVSE